MLMCKKISSGALRVNFTKFPEFKEFYCKFRCKSDPVIRNNPKMIQISSVHLHKKCNLDLELKKNDPPIQMIQLSREPVKQSLLYLQKVIASDFFQ